MSDQEIIVADNSKYTIHLVDDSPMIINMLTKLLESNGYKTTSSTNGQEALDYIHKNKPSLIILDVEMPVMDGYETIKHLKRNKKTSNIPVIFHTTLKEPEVIESLFELGAADYLSKPLIPKELLARVGKEIKNINLHSMLQDKIAKLAQALSVDQLTKLFNQMHMSSLITSKLKKLEIDKKEIFSLIYIDIDDFDNFTKNHGISASESALKKVAFLVNGSIRKEDILSRWNTSVFIVLCPVITNEDINKMAKDIRDAINKCNFTSNSNLTCSISMSEILPVESKSKNNLISELQQKIEKIKKLSKNSIVSIDGRLII